MTSSSDSSAKRQRSIGFTQRATTSEATATKRRMILSGVSSSRVINSFSPKTVVLSALVSADETNVIPTIIMTARRKIATILRCFFITISNLSNFTNRVSKRKDTLSVIIIISSCFIKINSFPRKKSKTSAFFPRFFRFNTHPC